MRVQQRKHEKNGQFSFSNGGIGSDCSMVFWNEARGESDSTDTIMRLDYPGLYFILFCRWRTYRQ